MGDTRSEFDEALNLLRSINGTLTTQTGLTMRDPDTQLVEYARRCDSAALQITAIADRLTALRDSLASGQGQGKNDV